MLKPADGVEGVKKSIIEAVKLAGPNACPPIVVGVGIGGNFEKCTYLAKKALTRKLGTYSDKSHIAKIEKELLEEINNLDIGPGGLGGNTHFFYIINNCVSINYTHVAALSSS